ncbi:MAG: SigB/SigF/SigG family RNA polymerase sigma factor [Acidimicrobiia bacterium]
MSPELVERFYAYRESGSRDVRNELVEEHIGFADFLARRFSNRGEPNDDLRQVAFVGLVKAVERFDPDRGVPFVSFAVPTITGEIKRHFRDRTWSVRVPRNLQELTFEIERARNDLGHSFGRSPTVSEIAAELDVSDEAVLEGLEAATMYRSGSLDAPVAGAEGRTVGDCVPAGDDDHADTENRAFVRELLAALPPRERRIVYLRYFEGLTQSEIADRMGISQMHVSRLLARSLNELTQAAKHPDQSPPVDGPDPASLGALRPS